jgi:transposase
MTRVRIAELEDDLKIYPGCTKMEEKMLIKILLYEMMKNVCT